MYVSCLSIKIKLAGLAYVICIVFAAGVIKGQRTELVKDNSIFGRRQVKSGDEDSDSENDW